MTYSGGKDAKPAFTGANGEALGEGYKLQGGSGSGFANEHKAKKAETQARAEAKNA